MAKKPKILFLNEYVSITVKMNVVVNVTESMDNFSSQAVRPVILKGWLLDKDEENTYLGDDEFEISFYVKNDLVAIVEKIAYTDELDEKLDELKEGISN